MSNFVKKGSYSNRLCTIGERNEFRLLVSVLILRELSLATPDLLDDHVLLLTDLIWTALWDPMVELREASAGVFAGCLSIASLHDNEFQAEVFNLAITQVQTGLTDTSSDVLHGSLLALKELFNQQGRDEVPIAIFQ